jgi:hypothetical protein
MALGSIVIARQLVVAHAPSVKPKGMLFRKTGARFGLRVQIMR